jgi:multidrug efflux pump subunit AcrB
MHDIPITHPVGRLAARFFRDRRLIVLTLLLAIASGVSSLMVLPRMEDPLLKQRAAQITTIFPGADATRVEALVTEKIEDKLLDVPEIKRLRSQSRAGISFISIELGDEVTNTAPVWSSIRGKLEDSIGSLPAGALRPQFDELDIAAYAWIGALVWKREPPVAEGVLRRLAREMQDVLLAVPGTKAVDLFGDPLEEILVEVDLQRAAAAGLPATLIAQQLSQGDVKSSAGMLRTKKSEIVVELKNQFRSLEDIVNVSLQTSQPGQSLRLGDVASVRRSTPEPVASKAIIDGRPGIVVSVMLRPEFRIDHWARDAQIKIDEFLERLPTGVELQVVMQQESYVRARMDTLLKNLFLGVAAVAVVTFLFLGWRSSLLVTATLPIAALMVLAGMRFLNIPIHQMSITGLIIAMGLLIDNAIIAADEIDISLRRGLFPAAAVGDMVSRLFAPLLASTVTTALAFAPIALMEGPAGEFVGSIALTVMLAIFSSLLLAMTVLPATAALLQTRGFRESSFASTPKPASLFHHGLTFPKITRFYQHGLSLLVSYPWLGILTGSVLPVAGFVAATRLSEQFFPPADRDQFHVELEMAPGTSLARTEEITRLIDQVLHAQPRIAHTAWFLGESAPPFYYNVIARRKNSPDYAQAIVTLDNNQRPLELIRQLQLELDQQFPDARILVRQLEQGPPFDAPVEVRVFGSDLDQLKDYGEQLRAIATEIPNMLHVRTALSDIRPVATVSVGPHQAEWLGLSEGEIAQQLFARLEGLPAGSIIEEVEQIPVRVRLAGATNTQVEELAGADLFSSAQAQSAGLLSAIPVASIATIDLNPQRALITRYNGRRMNEVQGFITAGTLPSKILNEFERRIEASGMQLPLGFSMELGGEASERDAAVNRLLANVSILVVGMIASLVLALASFRLTALIGLVAVLSIGLGMGALWLFGYPFGFMAIIGTMGLVGIAINDSIVVVAALSADEHARHGNVQAIVERVLEVSRHVLATTATTVVGFLPLLLSGGEFWPPLAVSIGAGVTGATLISLTLVPAAFRLIMTQGMRAQDKLGGEAI